MKRSNDDPNNNKRTKDNSFISPSNIVAKVLEKSNALAQQGHVYYKQNSLHAAVGCFNQALELAHLMLFVGL
jgi:hypothetical protein